MAQKRGRVTVFGLIMLLSISLTPIDKAEASLNGVTGVPASEVITGEGFNTNESVDTDYSSNAEAIGGLFENVGVDSEASQKAQQFTSPFAKFMNVVVAVILAVIMSLLALVTVADLSYIAIPFTRGLLMRPPNPQTGKAFQLISDEALVSVGDNPQAMQQGGMQGGMGGMQGGMGGGGFGGGGFGGGGFGGGGFGGGGFGGGMGGGFGGGMGGQQQQQPVPTKMAIMSYLKKRSIFLVAFGVCAILFSTTVFTDLGVIIASKILEVISNFL